ncbi:hypothetical protein NAI54_10365, partial [Francisella tularensis subsp. holarctica]|uniref:hypothetical protein n=1 Tax=Francisella tularensis TaxID=263 RepID=UPI002381B06C
SIRHSLGENQPFLKTQDVLTYISDIERIITREALGTVKPNELVALRYSLEQLPILKKLLSETNTPEITNINTRIHQLDELV